MNANVSSPSAISLSTLITSCLSARDARTSRRIMSRASSGGATYPYNETNHSSSILRTHTPTEKVNLNHLPTQPSIRPKEPSGSPNPSSHNSFLYGKAWKLVDFRVFFIPQFAILETVFYHRFQFLFPNMHLIFPNWHHFVTILHILSNSVNTLPNSFPNFPKIFQKLLKISILRYSKKLAHVKKKQYFCTVKRWIARMSSR